MENAVSTPENIISLIVFFILMALLLALTIVFIYTYSKKRILNEVIKRNALELKHKTEMLHATLLAQEEERRTIARDLHDDIGSTLNIIYMNINKVLEANDNKAKETASASAAKLTTETIKTVRQLAHKLLPPILEKFGLEAALKELFEELEAASDIHVNYEIELGNAKLDDDQQLNIFRVTQELINNTLKHSQAKEIKFEITASNKGLYYSYQDDGVGYDSNKAKKGLGMQNIENRVEMLKGVLKIRTEKGKGFGVLILTKHDDE
jgi:signal transduction histidine kinase